MSEQENIAPYAELHAQLRLFCCLMIGSTEAADCMLQQIYSRALDHHDEQDSPPSERIRLFRVAADLCGVHRS